MELKEVLQSSTKKLFRGLDSELKKVGYTTCKTDLFLYGEGNIPVLLVAHLDTVHNEPPKQILYDREQQVMWSPQGLGADDRAGVFSITEIIKRGYHPHVLFTDLEESGGIGASRVAHILPPPDIRYMIELDRKGINDSVFYRCCNIEFEDYVNAFDFKTAFGSFSDISILCPNWGIAGVNLSIGYHHQHTKQEILCVNEMYKTIEKVCNMLENPPEKYFEYIDESDYYDDCRGYCDYYLDYYYQPITNLRRCKKKDTKLKSWSEVF